MDGTIQNCAMIENLRNLSEADFDLTVFRYLTFSKFISILVYQALWFSKLNILQDKFEGVLPPPAEAHMRKQNERWKKVFNTPEFHRQIDEWPQSNVKDGRELTLVNCWFLGTDESEKMWNEYIRTPEGVAIKSTIRKLTKYVYVLPDTSQIGRVKYVNFSQYTMSPYEASQAFERAFIKDKRYSHEQELRIATMNFKHQYCVSMKGHPYTTEECSGKNMNNFENPGLYIGIDIKGLIDSIVLVQNAPEWFENLIYRIFEMSKINIPIQRSRIKSIKGNSNLINNSFFNCLSKIFS